MPRISVLLPCFNHGQFIDEAVESVLAQTCEDFEIVIVDDGSTDPATVQKLSGYQAPKTRVLRTENRGLPAARNHAARHATGEIFCALDADDRLAPTWFEKALRALDSDPALGFVSHWFETFGDEQWTWRPERCDLPALLVRNAVNGAALVRRVAFDAVGGYEESMRDGCEDWDFWLRLVENGWPGTIIPEVLFFYRRRADSMSRTMLHESAYRRPLETLVARHEAFFREHFVDVIVAKEREALHLAREVGDLERDYLIGLEPALRRAREERDALLGKTARARVLVERAQELARLDHEASTLRAGNAALEDAAAALRTNNALLEQQSAALQNEKAMLEHEAEALRTANVAFDHEASALRAEVAALRSSWSWRISAPLRKVLGVMRGERP